MEEITEQCLKIIESHENGILQCDLWKLANIDSRKCSRIVDFLLNQNLIERTAVKEDNIRTFRLKKIQSLEEILTVIELKHARNEGPSLKEFIESHRLVVNQEIIRGLPLPPIRSYKILHGPLSEILIFDLLDSGKTISQLSNGFDINQREIRKELAAILTRQTLLEEGLIMRRSNWTTLIEPEKPEFVYSVIPLPLEAKIFDILLGFSLLYWTQFVYSFEDTLEKIPEEDVIQPFKELCCDYWEIPEHTFNDVYQKFKPQFFNSTFGPLPVIDPPSEYDSIKDLICNSDTLALQPPLDASRVNKKIKDLEIIIRGGFESLVEVQFCVIALIDVLRVCEKNKWDSDIKKIDRLNEQLFKKIFLCRGSDLEEDSYY